MSILICCRCFPVTDNSTFWSDLIVTLLGTFIGFGLSLWWYYVQTENSKNENYRNLLTYYQELITSIKERYDRQLKLIDEYVEKQEKDLLHLDGMNRITSNDFDRLKNIDNRGVFEAWVKFFNDADTIKKYKDTNSSLDFLEGSLKEINRIYESSTKEAYQELLVVKELIEGLLTKLSEIAREVAQALGEKRLESEFYIFLDSSIKKCQKLFEQEASLNKINSDFLEPLMKEYVNKWGKTPRALEILGNGKVARIKMNDAKYKISHLLEQLKAQRKRSEKAISVITTTEERIKQLQNN
jgi:hypothetical protein